MIKKTVMLFDLHLPFHDRFLVKLILKYIKDLKLTAKDEVLLGGDVGDFWNISSHVKIPLRQKKDVDYERVSVKEFLRDLRKASGKANIIWIMGNHCNRWEKYMSEAKLQAFASIPELQFNRFFGLDKYNVTRVDYSYMVNPKFKVKHGECTGKYPAKGEVSRELISGASGHSHKTDRSYLRGHNGRITWYSFGMLASKDDLDDACKYCMGLYFDQSFGLVLSNLKRNTHSVEVMHCDKKGFYSKHMGGHYGKA